MIPTIGRIVHYKLTEQDAARVAEQREQRKLTGNVAYVGDVFPAVVVRTWGDTAESACNLQVLLDGPDSLWVTSRTVGEVEGTFAWPQRS